MPAGPSRTAEKIVAMLVPPACREEVLGDLHERFLSRSQYVRDALHVVPLVILSRIRRTADPQVWLMQAFALYGSFVVTAWLLDGALLEQQWGLLRLAIPAAMAWLGLILEDAYARPARQLLTILSRGPATGAVLALLSQATFLATNPDWALPQAVAVYGCVASLFLASSVRMLFPPAADQLQGVNAPAAWLKLVGGSVDAPRGSLVWGVVLVAATLLGYLMWR